MEPDEEQIMAAYTIIFDGLDRLGPGDSGVTRNVLERIRTSLPSDPRIADFGCGIGASALVLAQSLPQARVLALDMHEPFISRLRQQATELGIGQRICAMVGDMAAPPALDGISGEFDLIWSESAIYSIGRSNALSQWRSLLRPNGWIVFSDIIWQLRPEQRSAEASAFWSSEYPDITSSDGVRAELSAAGYQVLDPVICDRKVWSNYYEPLKNRLRLLSKQSSLSHALTELIAEINEEIAIYDLDGDDVALAFFLARRDSVID